MAARIEPLLTVADLDACPDDNNRYELIEGELFVSRARGIPHQLVVNNLQMALGNYLKDNPIGTVVPGAGAIFSDYDAVIPDLAFVLNERWDRVVTGEKFTGALDLVIEVVSAGPENRLVEVYRLRGNRLESTATLRNGDEIITALLPGFRMPVKLVFAL